MNRTRISALARRLVQHLLEDGRDGSRDFLVNTIAGFVLLPRVVRVVILRLAGMEIGTPDVQSRVTFIGNTGTFSIGPGSYVNRGVYFELTGDIRIGVDCGIGTQSTLLTSSHPFDDDGHFALVASGDPITIGDRCWLGGRVTVLPGVTIGDDVVVAAGAVVTKDLAPGGLYAGVPARRIRDLPEGAWTPQQKENLARRAQRTPASSAHAR